jgi:hypothetical protein
MQQLAFSRSAVPTMSWVYLLGEATEGRVIKIGWSKSESVALRIKEVNREQHTDENFVLLAGVRGEKMAERCLQRSFEHCQQARGSRTEYFHADESLVEYVLWLRTQHYVSTDPNLLETDLPLEDHNHWIPRPDRRVPRPAADGELFPRHLQLRGPLAGTAWNWLPDPEASYQDYFTPPSIVALAIEAMGGIDLDAASHKLAQIRFREAGILIPQYFTLSNSAFHNPWFGRVWLNPPYGNYLPWFERIAEEIAAGHLAQICMISPMWAFATKQAQPYMARAAAMVVLSPTPHFYNPGDPTLTGRNDPHAVVYWGDRRTEFLRAFREAGVSCRIDDLCDRGD